MRNSTLLAFLGGAAAGFVAAMLVAPKTGAQTRSDIRHMLHEAEHKLHDLKVCAAHHGITDIHGDDTPQSTPHQ